MFTRAILIPIPATAAASFWRRVKKTATCWFWAPKGTKAEHRATFYYAAMRDSVPAARFAWTLVNGPIPPGMNVLHTCDDEACVRVSTNPKKSHLFLGTQQVNMLDAAQKGRLHQQTAKYKRMQVERAKRFTIVNLRLFTEDVEELKRRAEAAGELGWQPHLRRLVHEALRARRYVR